MLLLLKLHYALLGLVRDKIEILTNSGIVYFMRRIYSRNSKLSKHTILLSR